MRTNEHAVRETRIREIEDEFALFAQRVGAVKDFDRLFREYAGLRQRRLEAMAARITQCAHAAEDVVQEAFVVLHRRLSGAHLDGDVGPWLTKVVRNIAVDHVRKAKTRRAMPLDDRHTGRDPSPHDAFAAAEAAARLWECVADLPDVQRQIVELRALEGLDYAGIGLALNISAAAARQRYCRTVVRLRAMLSGET